ncbi:uncharacterized protein isoform X2 [Choristoneura fumiferana]|uniref:uncharacterized protein isoform X2 n=1 Tax=Choristoneura fumiferana TaxID=7141 RepID=UPI003D15EA97
MLSLDRMSRSEEDIKPDPSDLELFLPWVSKELQLNIEMQIERITQNFTSALASERSKPPKSQHQVLSPSNPTLGSDHASTVSEEDQNIIHLALIYDHSDNLVGLQLDKNRKIPRELIKIIGLVLPFHVYLTSVTISTGLDAFIMYELCKILPISKITDMCLDGCFVEEGNYYILLESKSSLVNLSLSRCQMGDVVVDMIASRLAHPLPGSKLLALNLSTNRISDVGARSIGMALRANIKLAYLNLADNMITDEGADAILNSCLEYPLSHEEVFAARQRNLDYLKAKNQLIAEMLTELKSDLDSDRKSAKKRKTTVTIGKKVKGSDRDREGSIKSQSIGDLDSLFSEKAETMAMESLGLFTDPHSPDNIVARDNLVFCKGNSTLCYLNLAYNNLSYSSVKKMYEVLKYQNLDKVPKGLVNVCLEGNPLPISSREMSLIDDILDYNLNTLCKRTLNQVQKKKPGKGVKS